MISRWPSQNTFRMWTVLYRTRSSKKQFGVWINVWRLAGNSLNITCNFLYFNSSDAQRPEHTVLYLYENRIFTATAWFLIWFNVFFCHRWTNNSSQNCSSCSSSNIICYVTRCSCCRQRSEESKQTCRLQHNCTGWLEPTLQVWFYFPNGRYIDCLSLPCATNKSKTLKLQYRY